MGRPASGDSRASLKRNILAARKALAESSEHTKINSRGCLWVKKQPHRIESNLPKAKYGVPGEDVLVAEFIKALEKGPREISSLNGLLASRFNDIVRKSALTPFSPSGKNDGSLKTWLAECGFVLSLCNRNQSWLCMPGYQKEEKEETDKTSGCGTTKDASAVARIGAQPEKVQQSRQNRPVWKEKEAISSSTTLGSTIESDILKEVDLDEVLVDAPSLAMLQPIAEPAVEEDHLEEAEEYDEEDAIEIEIVESDNVSMWTIAAPLVESEHEQESEDAAWVVL